MLSQRQKVIHMQSRLYQLKQQKEEEGGVLRVDETNLRSRSGKKKYFMLSQKAAAVDAPVISGA